MTKQEEFQLEFRIIESRSGRKRFGCSHNGNNSQNGYISYIIDSFGFDWIEYILEQIYKAENGDPYDDELWKISEEDIVIIGLTNMKIGHLTIPTSDWKALSQEWIDFVNLNT